jgi:glutamate/tyrosine decarboxylase-like PLP-dependent enzyme
MNSMKEPDLRLVLGRAFDGALAHLNGLAAAPVGATVDLPTLRARLDVGLGEAGTPPDRVIEDLIAATRGGHLGCAGGRFFAWVIGGALPSALAADWLTSAWDQNAALYACGPAAAVVEEVAGAWLKDLLDIPAEASFAFTTGCQMAHFTCLAAARHALLSRAGWDVERDGLCGAPPIRILANDQHHGSVERALRFLGLGTRALHPLATGADGRVAPATLREALAKGGGPTIVILNAGDLNLGAFDSFAELIPLAQAANAWVHIDGAFGLWAKASAAHRHLVEGIEGADSWATDAHKWLNTPQDSGVAFVRDRAAHRAAMTLSASYLVAGGEARDQIDWTPDWTRRARGFAVYAALRELGRCGVGQLIDRCCDHAVALTHGIAAMRGAELVHAPVLNQALVRFRDERPDAGESDHDRATDAAIAAINAGGEAFFSGTTWRGRRAMRISVCNWRTSAADVSRTLAAVQSVLKVRMRPPASA